MNERDGELLENVGGRLRLLCTLVTLFQHLGRVGLRGLSHLSKVSSYDALGPCVLQK
jgi:hypothetical protein